jgi:hypothetical protein
MDAVKLVTSKLPWASFEDWGDLHGAVNMVCFHGLCPGDAFRDWMRGEIAGFFITGGKGVGGARLTAAPSERAAG